MAPGIGIEPILAESKSVVLPLHYPGIIKQDTFFTIGVKPIAQPLSESAIRQMLESNQRVINDFAVRILKMERVARIELAIKLWQSFRLPLHHTRINLAYPQGLEPRPTVLETVMLPLH